MGYLLLCLTSSYAYIYSSMINLYILSRNHTSSSLLSSGEITVSRQFGRRKWVRVVGSNHFLLTGTDETHANDEVSDVSGKVAVEYPIISFAMDDEDREQRINSPANDASF